MIASFNNGNTIMTTKASIAADLRALGVELSASRVKKTTLAELQAMLDAKRRPARRTKGVFREPRPAAEFKPTKAGSKRHLMAEALLKGATIEDLMAATGWNRSTASSAILTDMHHGMGAGLRTEWDDAGTPRYFLVLPHNLLIRPPSPLLERIRLVSIVPAPPSSPPVLRAHGKGKSVDPLE